MNQDASPSPKAPDHFFKELLTVFGYAAAFASIPLFASFQQLQPPWPVAIGYVSSAIILVASVLVWEFGPGLLQGRRRAMLVAAVGLTIIGLFAYLYLYSSFVVPVGDERYIIGHECNVQTRAVYPQNCPFLGETELARAGYDPGLLFTKSSLTNVRLGLVAAWLVFVAGLMAAVAWAVAGKRNRVAPAGG